MKLELDFSNYTRKADLKNKTDIDTSNFAKKVDSSNLQSNLHRWSIDKLKNVLSNSSNLKSKVDKVKVGKEVPIPADVVKMMLLKKDVHNAKTKDTEHKTPDISNLTTNTTLTLNKLKWKTKYLVLLTYILLMFLILKLMKLKIKYLILLT